MTTKAVVRTRHAWIDALSAQSSTVARLDVKRSVRDEVYKAQGQSLAKNADAFNFAGDLAHNAVVVRTLDSLSARGVADAVLLKWTKDLTSRNTYGTFSELAAYYVLLRSQHPFDVQVPVRGADVLNPNGSDLDGRLRMPGQIEVYFDVKAFGFHEHLVELLTKRLSEDLKPELVQAEDSWDVPVSAVFELLRGEAYGELRDELMQARSARRHAIRFVVKPPARIRTSVRELDPERLAETNADYAFRYAKQFVRNKPFLLIFVVHPWVSGATLNVNVGGYVDQFTKALARRTFTQFADDTTPVFDVTRWEASRLISGLVFLDAWAGNPPTELPRYRCFPNPNAKNGLPQSWWNTLAHPYGSDMVIVDVGT